LQQTKSQPFAVGFFVLCANYSILSPCLPGVTPITRLNMAMKALTLS
jgi:hypothetical protein